VMSGDDGASDDAPAGSGPGAPAAAPVGDKKWYIVHTYSGHENKAKLTLLERVRNANLNEYFGDVLVPTESVMEVVKGQRRTTTRKFFPGYMFVQMVLDDRTFHLVKNTPKITGFLGGTKPTPVPPREIHGVQSTRRWVVDELVECHPRIGAQIKRGAVAENQPNGGVALRLNDVVFIDRVAHIERDSDAITHRRGAA